MRTRLCLVILMVSLAGGVVAAEVVTDGPITIEVPEGWKAEVINEKESAGHIDLKSDNAVIHVYTYERSNPNLREAMKDMIAHYSKTSGSQYEVGQPPCCANVLQAFAATRGKNIWPRLTAFICKGRTFYMAMQTDGLELTAEHEVVFLDILFSDSLAGKC